MLKQLKQIALLSFMKIQCFSDPIYPSFGAMTVMCFTSICTFQNLRSIFFFFEGGGAYVACQASLTWNFYAETAKINSSVEIHENSVFFGPPIPLSLHRSLFFKAPHKKVAEDKPIAYYRMLDFPNIHNWSTRKY